ncbi:FAD/NAD-P-binding domain-containing protein [Roridomyces roridus]|uniref:L-ornithine N(5)-monooxygenase [NAD(P)H] n=1 Tax=Roridomyces roridus TaxID=1738132 RepID=A0AAD7FVA0_9AGAR|nr:FAD/NAD-P-binding domain-containing protein [Roridomyces roridus]
MPSVAVIGAGAAGLLTTHTLSNDGFDVQLITRDASPGGTWTKDRVYPGLYVNNVHGEYRFSAHQMVVPPNAVKTGGRLSGCDMRDYMVQFADRFLAGKIVFDTEVLNVRREAEGSEGWVISARNLGTEEDTTLRFSKIVLCTGRSSKPKIPEYLSSGFQGPTIHSAHFAARREEILSTPGSIVVVGGGKSAQDICANLANEGREVTVVFEKVDAFSAGTTPLPNFIRKSRLLSLLSPHIQLRTRLERFLHTSWIGSKLVHGIWNAVTASSFKSMGIPPDSPLRLTASSFWSIRVNDEGVVRENGFHRLVNSGAIKVVAPARATGLSTGQSIKADLVILATGYTSSWDDIFDEKTANELGLYRHMPAHEWEEDWKDYKTLANPPPMHPENTNCNWSSSIYKGIIPARNLSRRDFAINGAVLSTNVGYTWEVAAHWISSYFLGDEMKLPANPEEALKRAERDSMWLRRRHPELDSLGNEAFTRFCEKVGGHFDAGEMNNTDDSTLNSFP